jgi:starch phosphorylase
MTRETGPAQDDMNGCLYSVRLPVARPASDYTPRLIPHNDEAIVPLEAAQILWK